MLEAMLWAVHHPPAPTVSLIVAVVAAGSCTIAIAPRRVAAVRDTALYLGALFLVVGLEHALAWVAGDPYPFGLPKFLAVLLIGVGSGLVRALMAREEAVSR